MTKKFKFRLEKVLEYRELLRNDKKKELLLKNKAVNEAQARLDQLKSDLDNRRVVKQGQVEAQELHLNADYESRLKYEIEQTISKIQFLTIEAERAKEEYIEAVKEHEALKVLKLRKMTEYNQEVDRAEAKFIDELAVQKAGRKE